MTLVLTLTSWMLTAGATTPDPPPTVPAPDSHFAVVPQERRSLRLLEVQLGGSNLVNPFVVRQGGKEYGGSALSGLVAAYPDALLLATEAADKYQLGTVLLVSGLVADLAAVGTAIGAIATQPSYAHDLTSTSAILLGCSLGFLVVGITLSLIAPNILRDASNKWLEAVNVYNRRMVDGEPETVPSRPAQ